MALYHNSASSVCRSPFGALRLGETVTLRLLGAGEIREAFLVLRAKEKETLLPMSRTQEGIFEIALTPDSTGIWEYRFHMTDNAGQTLVYSAPTDDMGGEGIQGENGENGAYFRITVYEDWEPRWALVDGVMYQIFPDRFCRSKMPEKIRDDMLLHENWEDVPFLVRGDSPDNVACDFFGGDLKGILSKLDTLKAMGFTVLYLNPVFLSRSNHRYDTGDYTKVDPLLGTNEDLIQLFREAEKRGMTVLLDGVFNHTGADSIYFNKRGTYPEPGAYQGKTSRYYDWFTFDEFPDRYRSWWGIDSLPTVNKESESWQNYILGQEGVLRTRIREGAGGWRLDVADELPMSILRKMRNAVRAEDPNALLLGEVWEDASSKVSYGERRCYCAGDTLDSVMNYPLRDVLMAFFTGRKNAYDVKRLIDHQKEQYPAPFYYCVMNLLGSHDKPRAINILCGRDQGDTPYWCRAPVTLTDEELRVGKRRYLMMLKAICALPGIPCVYYGDEAGMTGGDDPYCRGTYPWGKEDAVLKEEVHRLLLERLGSPALRSGSLSVLCRDEDTFVILRSVENGRDALGRAFPNESVSTVISRKGL